jgi:hypothetical protein
LSLTEIVPPAAPLSEAEAEALDELDGLGLGELPADEPGDRAPKLGRAALVPRTTCTCPALTALPACAVTPNSAAILAAFAFAAAPDP